MNDLLSKKLIRLKLTTKLSFRPKGDPSDSEQAKQIFASNSTKIVICNIEFRMTNWMEFLCHGRIKIHPYNMFGSFGTILKLHQN
ncbi:hypothetical protein IW18_17910 [Flavobacterium hibernum]|uniref:Uncharacterized protein n=1 Tax=Flavobacterium hibernum TaxID=37752 RepID=A0A0D0EWS5_9FLAO|nr:hypothetical protein IW18_17910 [Flavobacterium hibernum]OXA86480.1 hypothetical protein B0A73_14020 [Flavobacterium hibernum]